MSTKHIQAHSERARDEVKVNQHLIGGYYISQVFSSVFSQRQNLQLVNSSGSVKAAQSGCVTLQREQTGASLCISYNQATTWRNVLILSPGLSEQQVVM